MVHCLCFEEGFCCVPLLCFLSYQSPILSFQAGSDGEDALVIAFSTAKAFVHDVLGNPAQLKLGLVDAEDETELDSMLSSLEVVWNKRERPYNSPPQFHSWFLMHCRQTVVENMM